MINQLNLSGTATNTIDFQISPVNTLATITLTSNLPAIDRQVTINGYSQGGPTNAVILIQLNLSGNNGLVFNPGSGNSTVQGLSIYNGFTAVEIETNNVTVAGNFLGVQADGTTESPNTYGVLITGSNNTISGANIIGANIDGIDITGSGVTGNVVQGNFIGTNASGANLGNTGAGVMIDSGAFNNTIGPANTIGFNGSGSGSGGGTGIEFSSGAFSNVVLGNFIGTNASGANLGNIGAGVLIDSGAFNNTIGGAGNAANTIGFNGTGIDITGSGVTGNVVLGNFIGTNASGANLGNTGAGVLIDSGASNNTIGQANTIGFNGTGIEFSSGAFSNVVQGNFIGTNARGANLGNTGYGVLIDSGAFNNTIGGAGNAANTIGFNIDGIDITGSGVTGNVVQGNFIGTDAGGANLGNSEGVVIDSGAFNNTIGPANTIGFNGTGIEFSSGAFSNVVLGNFIGTNSSGAKLGNTGDGVLIDSGAFNNTIGGAGNAANTIGFNIDGIDITGSGVTGNVVLGNFIGTNASGVNQGNTGAGVLIDSGAFNNTIGPANTIGFNGTGIEFSSGAFSNVVLGNFIGTNTSGAKLGNTGDGVLIDSGAFNNTIGGAGNAANTIGFNANYGIDITGSGVTGNVVLGNFIGTNASGAKLGNTSGGVNIQLASGNTIGGTGAGAGNVIAFNAGNAVVVNTKTGNAVLSNSIHDNGGGIVLTNKGNNDQAAPVLTDALLYSNRIHVDGSLAVAAGTSYIVQYFGNNPPSGQGQTLLGSQAISTQPANGTVTLSFTTSPSLPAGSTITAVASVTGTPPNSIDPALGDTSAFSTAAVLVNPFIVTNTNDSGIGSLRQAILYSNANPGLNTITFIIPGAGLHIISPGSPLPDLVVPVVIDATTQPGFGPSNPMPVIELNGADAGNGASGFTIDTQQPLSRGLAVILGGTTIRGLLIDQFGGYGIVIDSNSNLITGDWIGTNAEGTAALGNGLDGIFLNNSAGNTISGNLISGNGSHGINLSTASDNLIEGNKIGVNAGGMGAIGNVFDGIFLSSSAGNTISGNLISGNGINQDAAGINLESNDRNNTIAGNEIGTNAAGDAMLGNSLHGIFLGNGSSNNMIGGPTDNDRNVISGNGQFPVANSSTQGGVGVYIYGANTSGNVVQRNYIGTNAAGTDALTNSVIGVLISQSSGNTVQGNLISGNRFVGLEIAGGAGGTASGNLVQGNLIGTNAGGTRAVPNGLDGIFIYDAPNNAIGGTAAGAGNLISGNGSVGIQLFGPLTQGNVIEGNALGLDSAGRPTLPNRAGGIFVNTGPLNNQVGGTARDQANRGQTRQQLTVTGFHQSHAGSKTRHSPPAGHRFRIRSRARTSLRALTDR